MKNLGWVAAAVLGYIIYKGSVVANAAEQLRCFIYKVTLNSSQTNFWNTQLDVTLRIQNPTNTAISFERFVGNMSIRGQVVADAATGGNITLKPADTTDVTFPVIIRNISAVLTIKDILQSLSNKGVKELLTFTGTLYAGGLSIPFQQSYSFSANKDGYELKGIGSVGKKQNVLG